jgi:CheY-like chemotaxis protein
MVSLKPAVSKCVLVVEDDDDVREALVEVLSAEGYEVTFARNGNEAFRQLEGRQPAVILLDLMMPGMNGWQFRAAQRQHAQLASIPVVIVTADGNAREKARQLDAAGYLAKPVELEALFSIVEKFCSPAA